MNTIENTLFIGKVLLHFPSLDSTNKYAIDLISKSNPSEGTVISTDNQQMGRGQIGSRWESAPQKNLTLSVIFYPRFIAPAQQFCLNQAISLGVFDFITKYIATGVKVKWSNDIYVEDRKIAGILIQNTLSARQILSSVVGIGINVNQSLFASELSNPTSLTLETGREYPLDQLRSELCQCLEKRYLQIKIGQQDLLQKDYLHHLYRLMEDALFRKPEGEVFSGRITGVDPSGKLIIEHGKGRELFNTKEIEFVV